MWSRTNKEFYPPAWFVEGLPRDMPLDGELFLARGVSDCPASGVCDHGRLTVRLTGEFDKCSGIVRRQDRCLPACPLAARAGAMRLPLR
jgi:hypothetical protein